jgi:triacylglycerol lipase
MTDTTDPHLDPELAPLLENFPDLPVNEETLPGFRAAMKDMAVLPDPASHPAVTIEEVSVPRSDGGAVRCLHFTPSKGDAAGALLQVHGGGFVMGSPEMDAPRNAALVEALNCAILSVDYRLAPEHPHPAGLEDCYAALQWLLSETRDSGIPVGLIGDSAGGGLAASLALLARDRGDRKLACQALIYPMIAPPGSESDASTADTRIGRYIWTRESNQFSWGAYLGDEKPDPATLAGLTTNLADLPPTFIATAELDLFAHDNLAFASRLMAAGNRVETHCYPASFHGFDRMAEASVSRRFTRDLLDFLQRHLSR